LRWGKKFNCCNIGSPCDPTIGCGGRRCGWYERRFASEANAQR
jgi:hypothetical protein